jgi:antitoxin MazE
MAPIKTNIVRIGNSKGIRIPKAILEECHLSGEVELESRRDHLVVRSAEKPRQGWSEAFLAMAQRGEDALLVGDVLIETSWEKDEWEW